MRHLIQMPAVRLGQAFTSQRPTDQGERDIEQHAGQQHRHDQEGQFHVVEPARHHRQDGENEPAELTAHVAHEDACAREIEGQEAGQARDQQQRGEIGEPAAVRRRDAGEEACRDQRHAAGEAVQPVDEVHRIGGEQQPQNASPAAPASRCRSGPTYGTR